MPAIGMPERTSRLVGLSPPMAFTGMGTACSIVLSKIVHKSEVENSGADGEGIKFATAKAHNFCEDGIEGSKESPAI